MAVLQRLYLYSVTIVALEVWVWSLTTLIRRALEGTAWQRPEDLAGALAGFLIGLLVFGLHWSWAQREAASEEEERTSAVRAWALLVMLGLTWGAVFHALAALLARALEQVVHLSSMASVFPDISWEEAVAILIPQALVGWYFARIVATQGDPLTDEQALARRWYRLLWLSYAVVWLVVGLQHLLSALFPYQGAGVFARSAENAVQGVVFAVGGAVLLSVWGRRWWQEMLQDKHDRSSEVPVGFLMVWALVGLAVALATLGMAVYEMFLWLLGETSTTSRLYDAVREVVVVGVPWTLLWLVARSGLTRWLSAWTDERRATAYRLLLSVVALAGLGMINAAVFALLAYFADVLFATVVGRGALASGLTLALLGLPLWALAWRALQAEASADDAISHSWLRRGYLYLVLFAALLAMMGFGTAAVFQVFRTILGGRFNPQDFFYAVLAVLWLAGLLVYHWRVLRADRAREARLAAAETALPVLVLAAPDDAWFAKAQTAGVSLVMLSPQENPPKDAAYQAVVLTENTLLNLPDGWRAWLQTFSGWRLVLPEDEHSRWVWAGQRGASQEAVRKALRALAKNKPPAVDACPLKWKILGYAGLAIVLLWGGGILLSLIMSILMAASLGI